MNVEKKGEKNSRMCKKKTQYPSRKTFYNPNYFYRLIFVDPMRKSCSPWFYNSFRTV